MVNLEMNLDQIYFDYILEYTFYCAILPERRNEYINQCYKLLKNKGKIIGIMLYSIHIYSCYIFNLLNQYIFYCHDNILILKN